MQKEHPELTQGLTSNPIPPKYVVYPARAEDIDRIVSGVADLHSSAIESTCPPAPGTNASKTSIGRSCTHITHRVVSVARYLWLMVLIAFVVLMVSSTLLVANTIRLSIFARRREIEVMKLVGATNWFVRGPFMIEGLLCGLAGAVVAIVLPRPRDPPARDQRARLALRPARADHPCRWPAARRCGLRAYDSAFPPSLILSSSR